MFLKSYDKSFFGILTDVNVCTACKERILQLGIHLAHARHTYKMCINECCKQCYLYQPQTKMYSRRCCSSYLPNLWEALARSFSVNCGILLKATGGRHTASSKDLKDLAWLASLTDFQGRLQCTMISEQLSLPKRMPLILLQKHGNKTTHAPGKPWYVLCSPNLK